MDENDIDYLNHLSVPEISEDEQEVALEGIARAIGHDVASLYTDAYRETKGWFLGIESKRRYIEEICNDTIEWLQDKKIEYRNLDLEAGAFITWLKTSELKWWRYYFLLDDKTFNDILKRIKDEKMSSPESTLNSQKVKYAAQISPLASLVLFLGQTFSEAQAKADASLPIDQAKKIDDLIKIVELYKKRSNEFFKAITVRKQVIKGTPFQLILLGATDLRRATKKTVNLAI